MRGKEPSMRDRLGEQATAKKKLLEKIKANAPQNDPEFAARQAERRRVAEERAARIAEKRAAKEAEERARAEAVAAEERRKKEEEDARRLAAEAERHGKELERLRSLGRESERQVIREALFGAMKGRQRR